MPTSMFHGRLNLNYSLTFSKTFQFNKGFVKTFSQNVNFGGTLNITPKWQTAVNGYYDITAGKSIKFQFLFQGKCIAGKCQYRFHRWAFTAPLASI